MQLQSAPLGPVEATPEGRLPAPARPDAGLQGRVQPALAGWRLLRCVGRGRRSSVWLAEDLQRGGQAALKLADPALDPLQAAAGFAREHALAVRLQHPHVLRTIEHGRAGRVAYLAMDYLEGGDLGSRLGSPHPPQQALAWLQQAAAALAQLHAHGLVHRDVKPANFLLRADGGLVLADFGLVVPAGADEPLARGGGVVGTPRYLAPEQLQGAPARPAADVYALGVLLHEMLAGAPPFPGQTLMEVLSQHLVAVPPRLAGPPQAVQRLVDAMLVKEAGGRLPDAAAVLAQIDLLGPRPSHPPARPGNRW